jgi:hypothetical protein
MGLNDGARGVVIMSMIAIFSFPNHVPVVLALILFDSTHWPPIKRVVIGGFPLLHGAAAG